MTRLKLDKCKISRILSEVSECSCSAPLQYRIDPSSTVDQLQLIHPDTEAYPGTTTHDDWDPAQVDPVCPGSGDKSQAPGGSKPFRTGPHRSTETHHAGHSDQRKQPRNYYALWRGNILTILNGKKIFFYPPVSDHLGYPVSRISKGV